MYHLNGCRLIYFVLANFHIGYTVISDVLMVRNENLEQSTDRSNINKKKVKKTGRNELRGGGG